MQIRTLSLFSIALLFVFNFSFAQGVAINDNGSSADPSAMLDVKVTAPNKKGVLFPRMTTTERDAIVSPAKGLLVYDSSLQKFVFHNGLAWITISDATTAFPQQLEGITSDSVTYLGVNNRTTPPDGLKIIAVGKDARLDASGGYNNIAIGDTSMLETVSDSNNIAVGAQSLLSCQSCKENVAVGHQSMMSNTPGMQNVAVGNRSLQLSRGEQNTAIGFASMQHADGSLNNTAVGFESLATGAFAAGNTALGHQSMRNTFGRQGLNTGIGQWSLFNTTGGQNTGVGFRALYDCIGFYNTAVGSDALFNNRSSEPGSPAPVDGSYNSGLGYHALYSNENGLYNTAVGANADVSGPSLTNATAIGYGAIANASNKVRIGNTDVTVIEGQVPFTVPSDGRFKYNVKEDVQGLDFILKLRPVTYQFDVRQFNNGLKRGSNVVPVNYSPSEEKAMAIRRTGFIAQEVEKAATETGYNFSGVVHPETANDHYSLSYDAFVVPLVKAVQDQQKIIESLQEKLAALEREISTLKNENK